MMVSLLVLMPCSVPIFTAEGAFIPYIEWSVDLRSVDGLPGPTTPQIVDLDADGTNEIVLTSADSAYALRPDGTTKWRNTMNDSLTGAVAADINGDGKSEVVIVSMSGTVYCLNHNGAQLWTSVIEGAIKATPTIVNFDDDEKLEMLLGTDKGALALLDSSGNVVWKRTFTGGITTPITVHNAHSPADTDAEIQMFTEEPSLLYLGNDGGTISSKVLQTKSSKGHATTSFDNEYARVVTGTRTGQVISYFVNGGIDWEQNVTGPTTAPVLIDLDLDTSLQVIIGDSSGSIYRFESDGTKGWQYGRSSAVVGLSAFLSESVTVMAVYDDGAVAQINGTGHKEWSINVGFNCSNAPIVHDVDKDSEMEVLITGARSEVALVETHTVISKGWPSQGHDLQFSRSLTTTSSGEWPYRIKWIGNMTHDSYGVLIADLDGNVGKEVIGHNVFEMMLPNVMLQSPVRLTILEKDGTSRGTININSLQNNTTVPFAADISGNKGKEMIIGNNTGVHAWAGNLTQVLNVQMENVTCVVAADMMGDERLEVFAGSRSGEIRAIDPKTSAVIWSENLGAPITTLTIADLFTDGTVELVASTWSGITFVRNLASGSQEWASKMLNGYPVTHTVADLDGDSRTDLVIGTSNKTLIAYYGNGTQMWETVLEDMVVSVVPTLNDDHHYHLGIITERITGDLWDFKTYMVDGRNGSTISIDGSGAAPITASPIGTQKPYELSMNHNTQIKFIGSNGETLIDIKPAASAPYFEDLDGDDHLEMVTAYGKNIVTFDLWAEAGPTIPWSMFGHDPAKTFNPFSKNGRFLPDLAIEPKDVSFDPTLINDNGTMDIEMTLRNKGSTATGTFNVTIEDKIGGSKTISIPTIAPFSDMNQKTIWAVGYQNMSFKVTLDPDDDVEEVNEDNNKATRPLFINLPPIVNAGPDMRANPGDELAFDGSGSKDPDGAIVQYEWSFGDGTSVHDIVATHSYNKSGYYLVWLNVTDNLGLTASDNATIHVNYPPLFMDWNPRSDSNINEGEDVEFWALVTDPDGDQTTIEWFLDDDCVGDGPSWSIWANYSSAGDHEVRATASDGNLTVSRTWTLKITESQRLIEAADPKSPVTIPEGQPLAFKVALHPGAEGAKVGWYIDGEKVQTGSNTFILLAGEGTQGEYELMVEVIGESGRDYHTWDVSIGERETVPTLRWTYPEQSVLSTNYGVPIMFGVSAEGGTIQWHINDAAVLGQNGQSFKFDLYTNDTYAVTVGVSSDSLTVSRTWNITVNHPPAPFIQVDKLVVKKGKDLEFTGRAGPTDTITSYKWDLGDGGTGDGKTVSHTFRKVGTYTVTLNVTDSNGLTSEASVVIVVKAELEEAPGYEALAGVIAMTIAYVAYRRRRRE